MITFDVNWFAVVLAAVTSMIIGFAWYSPKVFGKQWMKLEGITTKKEKREKVQKTMVVAFGAQLVMAFILAHFVAYTGSVTWLDGAQTGFWLWLGFVATKSLGMVLWGKKPKELYFLHTGHDLLSMLVMGALLAVL